MQEGKGKLHCFKPNIDNLITEIQHAYTTHLRP